MRVVQGVALGVAVELRFVVQGLMRQYLLLVQEVALGVAVALASATADSATIEK
jgi:hypothetical protein